SKQESLKEKRAEVKARDFVKLNDLNRILKNPEKCKKIFPYVKVLDSYQQRASVESTFYGIEGLETKLYTVPVVTIEEVVKTKIRERISFRNSAFICREMNPWFL
ncbi:hypothetical protein CLONEX_02512, partial [[Clostridium] nexile DSM 1787]